MPPFPIDRVPTHQAGPVEPLEHRRLFTATLVHHVLIVKAAPGVPNAITVGLSADQSSVVVTDDYQTGRAARVLAHADVKSFPLSAGIALVKVTGGSKADAITIDQTYGSFPIPTNIHGGGGNDTVTGGDEPDVIWGDDGNDLIIGGGGNDTLYGLAGSDTLIGGDGNDYLSGGTGRDSLEGDAGNDTLHDPFGPDTVLGGAGDNAFQVHSLAKSVNDFNGATDTLKIIPVPSDGGSGSSLLDQILGTGFPFL